MQEQRNNTRARVRLAVFLVLSIHVVGLMALLMQGCRKGAEPEVANPDTNVVAPPVMQDTNPPAPAATNPPVVPTPTPQPEAVAPAPVAPSGAQEYVVAKGDSFFTIAKKFNVKLKEIEDANPNVQPTKLKIGQKLQIPAAAGAAPAAAAVAPAAAESASGAEQSYTVKSGDTLTKIAGQFGTTVKAIRSENTLTTDKIKVGQKLKIPAKGSAPAAPTAPSVAPAPVPAPAPAPGNPTS